ncbi:MULTISPECIES: MFS transporter [unclassified Caulobacter]|uniref:MFS transporter n=1 Tax=unclassified Caulobacter TaxID=2648921 RepID=UPI000D3D7CCC|nr:MULTISPECIES: MFS transporter [unclassified Caulobacter]PTS87557.1 MFS transporter [Caulobacter sp. HMWF009]PTT08210.1 MFS transporter [Caulobacter sp. HMWF025]PTT86159.1 MFS transporter [Pseudomonas sp. HMWF010]
MSPGDEARPAVPVRAGFIAAYTLAQIGAFVSFMPLFQVLLPLKAEAIDAAGKAVLLSQVAFFGALTASVANLLAGAVSDRTTSRFGRRRPWMLVGALGTTAAYVLIMRASTPGALVAGVVLFQLTFNLMFSALIAVMPDRVPDAQKGRVAAFLSLGNPIGTLAGAVLIGGILVSEGMRYLAISAVLLLTLAPFVIGLNDRPLARDARPPFRLGEFLAGLWVDPRAHPDFAFAWVGRFLVLITLSLVQSYMLYYLQDVLGFSRLFPGHKAEEGLAILTMVATASNVAMALIGGILSDRLKRRKLFAAGAALTIAVAMLIFSMTPSWPVMLGAYLLLGCGSGCFYAVDIALVTQVLPSQKDAGKDLGVLNLANTLPQALAPVLAIWSLGPTHLDFRTFFIAAALLATAGGLAILPIRGVR